MIQQMIQLQAQAEERMLEDNKKMQAENRKLIQTLFESNQTPNQKPSSVHRGMFSDDRTTATGCYTEADPDSTYHDGNDDVDDDHTGIVDEMDLEAVQETFAKLPQSRYA